MIFGVFLLSRAGESAFLLTGIYLSYCIRNARIEIYREKWALGTCIYVEFLVSLLAYLLKYYLWITPHPDWLLTLLFLRSQLTVSVVLVLLFGPKVRKKQFNWFPFGLIFGCWSDPLISSCPLHSRSFVTLLDRVDRRVVRERRRQRRQRRRRRPRVAVDLVISCPANHAIECRTRWNCMRPSCRMERSTSVISTWPTWTQKTYE